MELSGTPLLPAAWTQCPPFPQTSASSIGVYITEVMYHALDERLMREQHEFIEITNFGAFEGKDLGAFAVACCRFSRFVGVSV